MNLANFISSCTAKSHDQMIRVFNTLSSNIDNEGADDLGFFKKAITQYQ